MAVADISSLYVLATSVHPAAGLTLVRSVAR